MTEEAELLQALIRHGCVNDGQHIVGEEPNADALRTVIEESGADIEVVDPEPTRRNLVARLPGTDPSAPALLLLAHTDVVPVTSDRWTQDPFGGELIDGFVWGRGALDMLGYAATMALAFRDHARSGARGHGDVVFAAVADEEMLGSLGATWLMDHRPELLRADWVLTEGGGSLSRSANGPRIAASVSEKGVWRLVLTVRGVPRHAALNYSHDDALARAVEVCRRLSGARSEVIVTEPWRWFVEQGWEGPARSALTNPQHIDRVIARLDPTPAHMVHASTRMTLAVTAITSNGSWNTVPSEARLEVQVRTLPGQYGQDVLAVITSFLDDLAPDVSIEVCEGSPATTTPPGTDLWHITEQAVQQQAPGTQLQPTLNPGTTDARTFRARGADAYGVGLLSGAFPMEQVSTMMHGDDERIDIASLTMMRRLWSDVLALHADVSAD